MWIIEIDDTIRVGEKEIQLDFIRASGPGGQNVNKLASAVQLRFDIGKSNFPEDVKCRMIKLAGKKVTEDEVLIITARRNRTQERNRADAVGRLEKLIKQAIVVPKPRLKRKPSAATKQQRVDEKRRRGQVKRNRKTHPADE